MCRQTDDKGNEKDRIKLKDEKGGERHTHTHTLAHIQTYTHTHAHTHLMNKMELKKNRITGN